ncbi:MAG: aminotransferase class I/II-fold pyridoxal phosphate-dependent enzyme [Eubacteriales bacterium]|nr:aminotransferase class I/II-fold pyridoxal phosphate-dependent enzyme [Eubacteriales bacterium]
MKYIRRNEDVDKNIFNQLEDCRQQVLARGGDVINLSVGTPDFQPDVHVMEAVSEAAKNPENYKYTLGDIPELKEAVHNWYERRYGVSLEHNQIMSVNGSQEGIAHVALPFVQPGDLVLAPDPGYPIFSFGPILAGAEVGLMPLREEKDYLIDFDEIEPSIADAAKMMVVSYPNNPTTAVADEEFYSRLVFFAKKHDILVVHDNAYSDLVMDGERGISFLSVPGAMEVGIEMNSLSKTYNLTGMRTSFALGNEKVIEKFYAFRSQIDYGMFRPAQLGAIAALNGPQDIIERNRKGYQARRDALCGGLRSIGWDVPDAKATMFVWAKIPERFTDTGAFVLELLDRTGVLCVPGDSFGELGTGYVRFALVVPPDRMTDACRSMDESGILKG